jgi:ubiquinone/menaquinone biosynthesis C-methylase UbiE
VVLTALPRTRAEVCMSEAVTKQAQWQKLYDALLGNQLSWVVDVGLKADLFRAIADAGGAGISETALARHLAYELRYVQVWCRAAFAFELLDWDETSGYRLAPHIESLLLDPEDPQYSAGRIQTYVAFYEDYRAFPALLKTGETWPRSAHDPWLLEAITDSTKPNARTIVQILEREAPDAVTRLEAGGSILDVGAGGGYHVVQYAKRFPRSRVVGLEFEPAMISLAARTLTEAGVGDRATVVHGDANALDAIEAYDLVTFCIALHETGGPAEYRNVLERVRRALKPGGMVVVVELPYPDGPGEYRDKPVYKMLAGVQTHEAVVGCGMITQGQLRQLFADAGFANPREAAWPTPTRFVMLGEK